LIHQEPAGDGAQRVAVLQRVDLVDFGAGSGVERGDEARRNECGIASNQGVAGEHGEADVELAIRAVAGDEVAFVEIVRRYDDGLRRMAFRLLGDRDAMDDVLQDAYLKAFASIHRFRGQASPRTWLYRIVYNACLDQLRRRQGQPLAQVADVPTPDSSDATHLRLSLVAALAALAPAERAAVLLVDAEGLSYAEAAGVIGVPAGTIASRLSRARGALRRALREREGASL
jgi:RNA polymerase sigma-70 factor, ECF subfamily